MKLLTGQPPFVELQTIYQVMNIVLKKGRPPRPVLQDGTQLADSVWSVITPMWTHQPTSRPSIQAVIWRLQDSLVDVDVTPPPASNILTIEALVTKEANDHGIQCSGCNHVCSVYSCVCSIALNIL